MKIEFFRKRSGKLVKFNPEKIRSAIGRAMKEADALLPTPLDASLASYLTDKVLFLLDYEDGGFYVKPDSVGSRVPKLEDVQDAVEFAIQRRWEDRPMAYTDERAKLLHDLYANYRKEREKARNALKVLNHKKDEKIDVTDKEMLIQGTKKDQRVSGWDRSRLEQDLEKIMPDPDKAPVIAKKVERSILKSGLQTVSSDLIIEMVNNELNAEGIQARMNSGRGYFVEKEYIDGLMHSKSKENSNITGNNPEAINLAVAGYVLKNWSFDSVYSEDVVRNHLFGRIYIHDANFPHRVYCSSHSIEYLKKYGLKGLINLNTVSKPAKSASVLTGHINTFLASMQAYYAGALGLGYVNVFYAPLLVGKSDKELHQIAQEFVFNCSQNAFSKGSQSLFIDANTCSGIPYALKDTPAIGPGGKYMAKSDDRQGVTFLKEFSDPVRGWFLYVGDSPETGNVLAVEQGGKIVYTDEEKGYHVMRYSDYAEEARRFAKALLTVWGEGDANGHIFEFPKCDFHICEATFSDPKEKEVYDYACEIAAKNGSVYFVFDRESYSTSACCRLRISLDKALFSHPENMRSCGFANVTVNIPQASYRTKIEQGKGDPEVDSDTWKLFTSQIDAAMDLAVKAHLQKKKHIANLMSGPNMPLWQIGKPANDGRPYVDLEKCVYIIGLIGLDDACRYLFGKSMHEDEKLTTWGLSVIAYMNLRAKEYTKEHGITFTLEESPAESAARRLARSDLAHFPEQAKSIVNGSEGNEYYTNSVHIPAYANVSLVERIVRQAMFHGMIDSGAITHAFIGEETPSAGAISEIVERTFRETQSAQITFSPEFTYCMDCGYGTRGIKKTCDMCGSSNVEAETRVVGYFSRISQWNKSKQFGELVDRHRGNYSVEEAEK